MPENRTPMFFDFARYSVEMEEIAGLLRRYLFAGEIVLM